MPRASASNTPSGASLRAELARVVGAEHVLRLTPSSPYNHDATSMRGLRGCAEVAVLPGSAAEVAAVLRFCYEHELALVPRGGGTGLAGGAVPVHGELVCSLQRLRGVRALEPELWRMHVEAGVSTRDVQRLARENGLCFPPDPGAAEQSQIGGNVATNAGGPHAFKYGATGSWVTGLEAALAPGELVQLGGSNRKDVAGYDLKALLVGSEGTLGIITAVRLRLLPAPPCALPLVAFQRTRAEGCAAILAALASGVLPAALDFLDGAALQLLRASYPGSVPAGAGFALLAELDGSREQAHSDRRELEAAFAEGAIELQHPAREELWRWREGFGVAVTAARGGKVSEDVVVPCERLEEALEGFARIAARRGLPACAWGHGADGNIHANLLLDPRSEPERGACEDAAAELFALTAQLGGSISGEHGVGWLKRAQLARQWPPRALELHGELKRSFDPKGLLNPGKKSAL